MKKNEIMSFVARWMDFKIIILSKSDRERQISDVTTYCGILKKNDTSEFIYRTETDSQI